MIATTNRPKTAQWLAVFGLLCVIWLFSGLVNPAMAFSIGDFVLNWLFGPSGFHCVGPVPVGKLFDSGGIPPGVDSTQMFTFFVAKFEDIMSEIYSTMFCGMQDAIAYPISAVLTLFVVLMGAGFLIGVIPFTGKELIVIFTKFVLVLTFTTQADLAIGVLYNFLVTSAREGINIVLSTIYLPGGAAGSTAHVFGLLDDAFRVVIDKTAVSGVSSNSCKNGLFAFLALALIAYPALFFFAMMVVIKLIVAFIRAVFGYLFGLLGITFLMTLLPIFASFALFKPTRSLFDKYLGYMTSFAFQMIVVFAFLALVLGMDIYGRFGSTFDLVVPVENTTEFSGNAAIMADLSKVIPLPVCTVCRNDRFYSEVDGDGNLVGPALTAEDISSSGGSLGNYADLGFKCLDKDTEEPLMDPGASNYYERAQALELENLTGLTGDSTDPDADPLGFMKFVGMQVLMLAALAFLIEGMLSFVPEMARQLGGQIHAAQLGGGAGAGQYGAKISMVGEGLYNTVTQGFERGYQSAAGDGGTTPEALARGFQEASSSLLVGRRDAQGRAVKGGGGIIDEGFSFLGGLAGGREPPGGR